MARESRTAAAGQATRQALAGPQQAALDIQCDVGLTDMTSV